MTDHKTEKPLLRAELARRTGCNAETIRYYEKVRLLPPPDRSPSGYRLYGSAHLQRLRFIMRSRELGFPVPEVRGLLDLVDCGSQSCAEVKQRTERHLADVRARIADLKRIEHVLAQTSTRCSGEQVPQCPVLDALGAAELDPTNQSVN